MKVSDVMTRNVHYIGADDTIQAAAEKMTAQGVGDLPVVIDGEAVGMVTDRDIVLRIVAPGLDPGRTRVFEAMTKGVVVCKEDDDLEIAGRMMGSRKLRRLPVINRSGELSGIVSLGDLAETLEPAVTGEILKTISQ